MNVSNHVQDFLHRLGQRHAGQEEYLQAVQEVVADIEAEICANEHYVRENLLERLVEPDRIISFRVCWEDDEGAIHVNRGWRVQHSNVIGPYKGGIRFHPDVNESVLKFLAFEQTFKNALTGLSIGGAKGGADFDPRGRSDREIMRFCQAFMDELYRYIGTQIDVPAGDINVGRREIGYLFGHYRRLANNFSGALTGKDIEFGGSHVRLESTGFGLVYFVREMLELDGDDLSGKRVAVSGAGNVAVHAALKAVELGARVITLSSSRGCLRCDEGFSEEQLRSLTELPGDSTQRLQTLDVGEWIADERPWGERCDIALPCASQNELEGDDARSLVENGVTLVAEGANMPCTSRAIERFAGAGVKHAPGKASNAGGVALSVLEMGQNADFSIRPLDELDTELQAIMRQIHRRCVLHGRNEDGDRVNYRLGANRAAFHRVAKALLAQGI